MDWVQGLGVMFCICLLSRMAYNNNNNNEYFKVLFLRRAHSPFNKIKNNNNGVNIELGKTNRLKALCMMQINT